jgi:hypothetical protein
MATKHNFTIAIPTDGKCIRYDRETGDYACYLNGEFIGYAATYSDGETLCNEVSYDLISSGACYTATDLDAVVQLPAFVGKISTFLAR